MVEIEKFYKSFKFNFSDKDIIKHGNNEYLSLDREGLIYIRNFCENGFHYDIDEYYNENELELLNKNIFKNQDLLNSSLNMDEFNYHSSACLISSSIKDNEKYLSQNSNSLIFGINDSLKKYSDKINIYLCNNPYDSALRFLPENEKSWPEGIFAYRSNNRFVSLYKGTRHGFNIPICKKSVGLLNINNYNMFLEDHRSLVLSFFNLAYYLRIKKIILINTENYIKEERPGSVYINKGIYMYPQQVIETSIINAGIYWLNKFGIKIYTYNQDFDFIQNLNIIPNEEV